MKPLLQSTSDQDITLSQRLSLKKSMTNIHADLPFGTPPANDMRFSLTNVSMSMMNEQTAIRRRKRPTHGSTTTDDTFSAFSSADDPLPDESTIHAIPAVDSDGEQDMVDVGNIANALARRRGVAPSQVMPQLLELFGVNPSSKSVEMLQFTYSELVLMIDDTYANRCSLPCRVRQSYMQCAKRLGSFCGASAG